MRTPKKAWKLIVVKRMTRSARGDHFFGPGSIPMRTHVNMYPVARKCAIMSTCPVWVLSASSKSGL